MAFTRDFSPDSKIGIALQKERARIGFIPARHWITTPNKNETRYEFYVVGAHRKGDKLYFRLYVEIYKKTPYGTWKLVERVPGRVRLPIWIPDERA